MIYIVVYGCYSNKNDYDQQTTIQTINQSIEKYHQKESISV